MNIDTKILKKYWWAEFNMLKSSYLVNFFPGMQR
jgi:hypothetical protein